jgi:nitrite reductase/ring-hydroxylating ferredoxin subunit/uncharacterized membrane protein
MPITETVRILVHRLGELEALDAVAKPLASTVRKLVPPGVFKDLLSGTWLGHPLHPLLTDVTIGAWTSALVLDLIGDERTDAAAQSLVGVGLLSAVPTAAAGLSDWSDTLGADRRIGFVHAAGNVTGVALYLLSYLARRDGRVRAGKTIGLLGSAVVTTGAYLGGHLIYRLGWGVDRNAWKQGTDGWETVAGEADLDEGKPVAVQAGDDTVLLFRTGAKVYAISNICGHAGGPLHEGTIAGGCVTCPWHGSTFRLVDGHVMRGPATGHQAAYDVRVEGGNVRVHRRSR